MVVCGISGRRRHAAAAIAIDGRLVAAVDHGAITRAPEAGYAGSALPAAAVEACLVAAGLSHNDITHLVCAEGDAVSVELTPTKRPAMERSSGSVLIAQRTSRLAAYARLARAAGASRVVVAEGTAAMLVNADETVVELARAKGLLALACRLAGALGSIRQDSLGAIIALEQLASTYEPSGHEWFEGLSAPPSNGATVVNEAAFEAALAAAAAEAGAPLANPSTPFVRAARVVADVASAFLSTVAAYFGQVASEAGPDTMLAGSVFGSPDFLARVRAAAGRPLTVAPFSEPGGAAAGAALSLASAATGALPESFALGPPVSEADAKAVLENCRLDYIYEPRWPRLLERVSRVLERGKLVAWFQGPAEFGHPFMGSRSILCDPSNRYARDNVNLFLRRRALSTPIPISIGPGSPGCVDASVLSPWALTRTAVANEWRDKLRAAVDGQGQAHAHVIGAGVSGPFPELLTLHHSRTGVPGLLNLPLCAMDEAVAISPRDAVRAAFASSVDALVIHRFVIMKDYWQMRDAEA